MAYFIAILLFTFACTAPAMASAPSAPTNPAVASNLQEQTSLSWTASSGASSYNIYRSTSSGQETEVMTGVSSNFFEDTGSNNTLGSKTTLGDGTNYYYKVTAVNGSGESAKSSEVSVITQSASPASFTATAGDSQVVLNWSASPGATSYRIYRDSLGGVAGTTNFLVTGTSYTDTGLVNGTTYFYQVDAVNGSGENRWSQAVNAATPVAGNSSEAPTGPPTSVTATAGNGLNIINWTPIGNATSYDIYRSTTSGSEASYKTGVTALTFTDTSLTNGTTYYYKVRADNAGQSSSLSATEASATPYAPSTPSLTVKASSSLVVLTWTATGTSYAVYRSTASGAEVLLNSGLTGTTFTDASVTNGTTYYYKVQALNSGGTGPLSSEMSATPTGPTAAPWSSTVSFNLAGEPVQSVTVTIPDLNRPVLAAIFQTQGASSNMQALATKYNAITINMDGFTPFNFGTPGTPVYLTTANDTGHTICILDYRWPQLGAQRIQALLNAVVAQIASQQPNTPHPEIANTGLVLYGFSEGTDNTNLTITPYVQSGALQTSPIASRILAVIQLSELDEDVYNPISTLDTAPHLLLASGLSDINSSLNLTVADLQLLKGLSGVTLTHMNAVTHDTLGRGIATNQGGTLTLLNNAGAGHGSNPDLPFISIWLDDVLSQRLPASVPQSTVSLPSWQNTSSWVGTYNVTTNSSSPWNGGVQLVSTAVTSKSAYSDTRQFTWLPSQNTANTWLNYSNTGGTSSFSPVIISATTATATVNTAFTYQITALNEPTSYSATGLPSWLTLNTTTGILSGKAPGTTGTSTISLTSTNANGSGTATLTLTVGTQTTQTSQTISAFATISSVNYGVLPFAITPPTASSGLPVTVTVLSGPATILGNIVSITGAGTVVLAANQAGNSSYSAAPQVTTSFTVNPAAQTISAFPTIATQTFGLLPLTITLPTASSGLPVTVTVQSGPATIIGNIVTLTGAGTVVLAANQAGNANYSAAPQVTTSFTVNPASATPQTFSQWETTYGISGGPSATPQNDGVTNLMKYLCGIDPTVPVTPATRAELPVLGSTTIDGTDYVTLTFRENPEATGISISLAQSTNLMTWTTISPPDLFQQIGVDPATQDPIMEIGIIAGSSGQQFIRLNVALP